MLYATVGTTNIQSIHVYDSDVRIDTFDNLNLSGDHSSFILDNINTWVVAPEHAMKFGLGISVLVDFGPPTKIGVPEITFFSAGADFVVP